MIVDNPMILDTPDAPWNKTDEEPFIVSATAEFIDPTSDYFVDCFDEFVQYATPEIRRLFVLLLNSSTPEAKQLKALYMSHAQEQIERRAQQLMDDEAEGF